MAAIDGTGELATVLGALAELGVDADALDPAERAGLIRTDRPLSSSAIRSCAPPSTSGRLR